MNSKPSPYQPIPPELAASGMLISIKQAAVDEEACESTLKANAKSRRLPAYQSHFGASVMVIPGEVREFLKSRPDIASKHHPKAGPAVSAAGCPTATIDAKAGEGFAFPDANAVGPIGDLGISIRLRSLNQSQPVEIGLVANCFIEVGRQLLDLVPFHTKQTNH